jgi:IMP dehydrogenase
MDVIKQKNAGCSSMKKAKDIMVKNVVSISGESKVALARLKMLRHNVGALPVVKDGRVIGMITLRDVDLAGNDVSNLPVGDLMSKDLVTCREDTPAKEIAELMIKTGIQRIPVVSNEGKLLGLVTQTCIIKAAREVL